MHSRIPVLLLILAPLILAADNNLGVISGRVAHPQGAVSVVATNLENGEQFSAFADARGGFTLGSLPAGSYRVVIRDSKGTAVARHLMKVRAGETVRLNTRLEAVSPARIDGRRTRAVREANPRTSATPDSQPVIQQFSESSRYFYAVTLVDDNNGWAVGEPHWDQSTHQIKGTIAHTTDGGATWTNQDPGTTATLYNVFFLSATQGWAVGDSGTILRTTDGGAHWTAQALASNDTFESVFFSDALNGWASGDTPIEYWDFADTMVDWRASMWHTADGGQTWAPQTIPASTMLLKRVFFLNSKTGFAAGLKRTGYDVFNNPTALGAIYSTTDGGTTWNEIYATSDGFTFTSLYFTDASNGWVSGFPHDSIYDGPFVFHTADGGKTWQGQPVDSVSVFDQVRDLRMVDANRGYFVGTAYLGDGTLVNRTLDGGAHWTSVRMANTNPLAAEGYWGVAVTTDRVRIVGDRDVTAYSTNPWGACTGFVVDCSELFTQADLSPHYIFHDVTFTDRNHGWAAGTRTFTPQIWGQEILATQDGGQTWTSQFEQGLSDGLFSYQRLDGISFADAQNGWAVGSAELYKSSSGSYSELGCILHTSDGGKTWTDQTKNISPSYADEFSAVQFLDAQNGWALATQLKYSGMTGTIQLAHTTDGGNHWTLVDTGISGEIAVGYELVQGGVRFIDAQHGCFGGWDVAACTSDGGAHWTQSTVNCADSLCYLDSTGVAYSDSTHVWITGGDLDKSTDGGASFVSAKPKAMGTGALEAIQFPAPATGWVAGDSGVLYKTADSGADWLPVDTGTGYDLLGLSFTDATHGWVVGDFGTVLSYAGDRTPAGAPAVFAAINAASYTTPTAPGTWISIFGANLSATTRTWLASDFVNNKLPTKLDGVSVLVNGNPGYPSYISPTQINVMFPDDGSTGQVSVQVVNSQGSSGMLPVQKAVYSPSLFRLPAEQGNYAIAQTTDGKLVGNYMVGYDLGIPTNVRTAMPGEIITLYGTGFGPTNPATPSDVIVSAPAQLASTVSFTVGGTAATVKWAGLIGPGLYQFNIQVPPGATNGDLVIVASIGGYRSQGDSVISVGQD